jgi:hypothetical protein
MIRARAMGERCDLAAALENIIRHPNLLTPPETDFDAPTVSLDETSS